MFKLAPFALALSQALLAPLPGLPSLPDGSGVRVVGQDLQASFSNGTVGKGKLTLSPAPPGGQRVQVLIAVEGTGGDAQVKSYPGQVSDDRQDIILDTNKGTSFRQVLDDAYRIKLEIVKGK